MEVLTLRPLSNAKNFEAMFLVLRSTPPFLASVVGLFSTLFSLLVPWSCLNVIVDNSDYQVSLPANFGLLEVLDAERIDQHYAPFLKAALTTVLFLIISAIVSLISISISVFCVIKFNSLFFNGQNLLLVAAISFNLLAIGFYIISTVSSLDGGSYTNGIWLNAVIVLTGLFCVLISLFADAEMKRVSQDIRILPEPHAQRPSRYMSIEEG